ncbi:type II toxin-antitoxin system HicA family toxin [Paramicrobacterium agarici]|nr:type II toxin-antitoxin system HicA family toxin [Microbacterium agarici]
MPKPQKYRDVARFLRSRGWQKRRSGKGSHEIWEDTDSHGVISIPRHGEVSAGIVRQIMNVVPDPPEKWR